MAYAKPRMLAPHAWSATDLLLEAGMDRPLATIAVSGIFWTPAESDPASPVTEIIVYGAQRMLKKVGYRVKAQGIMDAATQNALAQVGGPTWASQPWFNLYDAIRMKAWNTREPLGHVGHPDGEALGLGATDPQYPYLDHALVPESGSGAVKFAAVATLPQAVQYAAAGFHEVVRKGTSKSLVGSKAGWNTAAKLYLRAYEGAKGGYGIEPVLLGLTAANLAASAAAGQKPPPVHLPDTLVDMSVPPPGGGGGGISTTVALGIAAAGLGAMFFLSGKSGKAPRRKRRRR